MSIGEDTPEDDDRVRAGEYVLGLLPPEDMHDFESRLVREPALRAMQVGWAEDLVALTDGLEEVAPPPRVWQGLQATLFGATARRGLWQRLGLVPLVGGMVAAGLIAYVVVNLGLLQPPGASAPELVATIESPDASLTLGAVYDRDSNALVISRSAGLAPPGGRAHEAWVIIGSAAPVSLGVLSPEGVLYAELPADIALALEGGILAISDEPEGGSPTGAPTGAVLATGAVTGA